MNRESGTTSKKIILLLWGGLALGLSGSPKRYFKILKGIEKELKEIDRRSLHSAIKNLYKSKLIDTTINKDGTITLVLTKNGKNKALKYNLENMKIPKMKKWDRKWRMVLFDIPEARKKTREALRFHLKELNFFEFQKSVFVHPYECQNEIDYIIEFYDIRKYTRILTAETIDNELHLKNHFKLHQYS